MAKEKNNQSKKKPRFYRFIIFWIKLFYRKREYLGQENMPEEASIYVTNHAQYHMPFSTEFYFPTKKYIWCIGEMMKAKEVPAYTYKDFWSHKPKWTKWFFKMLPWNSSMVDTVCLPCCAVMGDSMPASFTTLSAP